MPKRKRGSTFRNACLTINNRLLKWTTLPEGITYLVWQHEKGTCAHTQAYAETKGQHSLNWFKKTFSHAHVEQRGGSQAQAIAYCRKSESRIAGPWELGRRKRQGTKATIPSFIQDVRDGKRRKELLESHPHIMARHSRFFWTVRSTMTWPVMLDRKVHLYYGKTGTGKTKRATLHKDHWLSPICDKKLWFDGYEGQKVAILDEFHGGMKRTNLLRLLDVQCPDVEVKHGFTPWIPKKIIITSNYQPCDWYKDWEGYEETYNALIRRITAVYYFVNGSVTKFKGIEKNKILKAFP